MNLVELAEFLTLGSVGPIRLGLTPANVESACGPPDDTSTSEFPRIWTYGALQVTFLDRLARQHEELALIGIYFRVPNKPLFGANQAIEPTGWWPAPETTCDDFVAYLRSHDIEWSVDPQLTYETQTTLRMPIGVLACFDKEHSPPLLDSIQFAAE